jgi:hypothetical protein
MLGIASEKLHYGYGIINQAGNRLLGDAQLMERPAGCDAFLKETTVENNDILEKIEKAMSMARIYLHDEYEFLEVAEPLRDAVKLLLLKGKQ